MSLLKTAGLVLLIFGIMVFVCMVDSELPRDYTPNDVIDAVKHVAEHPENFGRRIGELIGGIIDGATHVLDTGNNALIGAKEVR